MCFLLFLAVAGYFGWRYRAAITQFVARQLSKGKAEE